MSGTSPSQVGFELGEDIRNENRVKQDEKWANAVLDGRVHLSNRFTPFTSSHLPSYPPHAT